MTTSSSLQAPRSRRLYERGVTSHHEHPKHAEKPPEKGELGGGRRRGRKRKERASGGNGAHPSVLNRWAPRRDGSARRDNNHVATATPSATPKGGQTSKTGKRERDEKTAVASVRKRCDKNATPTLVATMS
ncbi:hypothetical protein Taro_020666 [Colocasia esculenta]|uniref:Uncharacterized protein n=1 Tax=Colocasia esculenta TaxID=4460 RepID=A0A843V5W8_COLES|nr:hypothetical protein [Colocasia esculenta]